MNLLSAFLNMDSSQKLIIFLNNLTYTLKN